jgi:mannosyltransferase
MIGKFLDRIVHRGRLSWLERNYMVIIILGVLATMGISLAIGLNQSVWFDEAYSITLAKQDTSQLLHLASVDTHPPFYYLLLKAWASLFGWSEFALRSLSVLATAGAVTIGVLLVKKLFGVRAALITLPFVVFAPFLLRYGFEIRMYALASLIGIAATYVLVTALQTKHQQKQWKLYGLYAVLVALGVYTLYYTVLLWLAHLVWLIWMARKNKQPVVKSPWFSAFIGSIVLFLPWLPTFVSQVNNGALAPISQPLTIENLMGIISFVFVYQPSWQLSALTSLLVLFVIVTLTIFTYKAWRTASEKQRSYLMLLAMYVLVPVTVLTLVSLIRPMYVERYLAHVVIAGSLFAGVVVAIVTMKNSSKKLLFLGSGLLLAMLVGTIHLAQIGNYNFQRLQKPAINEATQAIGDCNEAKTIFAADPYVATELSYYYPACDIRFYSEWATMSGGYAPLSDSPLRVTNPEQELASYKEIVYVYYDGPKLTMPSSHTLASQRAYGSLNVAVFTMK